MVTKEEYQAIVVYNGTLHQKQSLDSTGNASRTDQEENVPIVPKKPSEDGYNWRKYGQKNVKGNEYIRSYYKCSYPNCLSKKQVKRSPDGWITDITYLGKHDHPKPHTKPQEVVPSFPLVQVKTLDCPPAAVKDKTSDVHAPITDNIQPQPMDMCERPTINKYDACVESPPFVANVAMDFGNENMTPKRRKRSVDGADILTEKPTRDSRLVVHTVSEVDIVNDGYRWRKYGQKMVKGSPNPRSYYRCSTAACSAKKHVERASYDPKVVITTYEGEHDHTIRPIRAVAPESQSLESDATQNGSAICEKVKNNAIVLHTAKEITTKEVVNTEPEIPPDGQSVQPETKRSDHNEQQMQDSSVSIALKSDNIDNQTVKQEKVAPIQEMKINAVSTKPQRPDNCDSQTVKQEKPDTVQEMKIEQVSTEQKTPDNVDQEKMDPLQVIMIEDMSADQQRTSDDELVNCST